jgi:hypothetical protein
MISYRVEEPNDHSVSVPAQKVPIRGIATLGAVYDRPHFVDSTKAGLIERPYRRRQLYFE